MGLTVCVHLFHQFLGVVPRCHRNLYLHLFLRVGVGFDVRPVNKYRPGEKIACLCHFLQDPTEYLVYRLLGKPMPEIVAHCGKVGRFLLQTIPQKPAVINTAPYLLRRPPQGGQPVQMLDQYQLEQHDRIAAGAAIVLAV